MASTGDWVGTWRGSYRCSQGITGLTLTISKTGNYDLAASFSFYAVPQNQVQPSGAFRMKGQVLPGSGHLTLVAGAWTKRPPNYVTVGLDGDYDPKTGEYAGRVDGPGCSDFVLRRDLTS